MSEQQTKDPTCAHTWLEPAGQGRDAKDGGMPWRCGNCKWPFVPADETRPVPKGICTHERVSQTLLAGRGNINTATCLDCGAQWPV